MKPIGYPTFLVVLEKRLKGKYSVKTLDKVIATYTSLGILSRLNDHVEFKDNYFGIFRLTPKGIENLSQEWEGIMEQKIEISKMHHDYTKRKKFLEKKLSKVWKIKNSQEGYKFVSKTQKRVATEKAKVKSKQMNYINNRLRNQLISDRKTRSAE